MVHYGEMATKVSMYIKDQFIKKPKLKPRLATLAKDPLLYMWGLKVWLNL